MTARQRPIVPVDLIVHNARIVTLDAGNRVVEAIAIQGDRIVASGTSAEVRALASPLRGWWTQRDG